MPLSKKDIRKQQTREAILKAALELAGELGWAGVSIRKIADRVHYTPPIVYEHFKNKDDLLHTLMQEGFEMLRQRTFAVLETAHSPEAVIAVVTLQRFDFAAEHRTLHDLMFDFNHPDWQKKEVIKSMEAVGSRVRQALAELSGQPDRVMDYFFNMVCLTMGYTGFAKHLVNSHLPFTGNQPQPDLRKLFVEAVERFIYSIKQHNEPT